MKTKSTNGNRDKASKADSKGIARIVEGINARVAKAHSGLMETGDFVLKEVFHGRLDEAQSRNPYKDKSLKRIGEDPKLLIDRRVLGTSVRVAHLKRSLEAEKVECPKLCYSHFVVLLRVTDKKKLRKLVAKANSGKLSVRQLEKEITAKREAKATGKAKSLVRRMEAQLAVLEDQKLWALLEDPAAIEQKYDSEDRERIAHAIEEMIAKMTTSTKILKQAKKSIAKLGLTNVKAAA